MNMKHCAEYTDTFYKIIYVSCKTICYSTQIQKKYWLNVVLLFHSFVDFTVPDPEDGLPLCQRVFVQD